MLTGVVSNTDGRSDIMQAAAGLLAECGADVILHAGDVGGWHVLDALAQFPAAFVWGDRDRDRMGLLRHAQKLQLPCYGVMGEVLLDEKRAMLIHGDEPKLLRKLLDEQQYDYVILGHGPLTEDRRQGKTRIIQPGSLHGASERTVALIDSSEDSVRFLTL